MRGAPRRGEARTGWVELRSAAPFGVAERRRRLPADATTLVLPRVVPLGALPFVDLASSREAATETEPRRGQGPEYLGVREYRPGDPIRQVHWRLTARHGELVVRDLEEHRVPRLALWIDTGVDDDALDEACSAAASIVTAATATGAGVRLAAAAETGMTLASRAGMQALHRWLARAVDERRSRRDRDRMARRRCDARRRHVGRRRGPRRPRARGRRLTRRAGARGPADRPRRRSRTWRPSETDPWVRRRAVARRGRAGRSDAARAAWGSAA